MTHEITIIYSEGYEEVFMAKDFDVEKGFFGMQTEGGAILIAVDTIDRVDVKNITTH